MITRNGNKKKGGKKNGKSESNVLKKEGNR